MWAGELGREAENGVTNGRAAVALCGQDSGVAQPTAGGPGNSVYLLQMCCRQSLMLAVSGRTGVVFAAEDAAYLSPDATHLSRRTRRFCVRIRGRNSV